MPAPVYKKSLSSKSPASMSKGRPSLLTKKREELLLQAIEKGVPLKQAANLAGVCYETFNRWRKRGELDNAPEEYRHLCHALRRSEAVAVEKLVECIALAGPKDWRSAAWLLERRFSNDFGRTEKLEHANSSQNPFLSPTEPLPEVLVRMKKQAGAVEVFTQLSRIIARKQREREELALQLSVKGKSANLRE